MRENTHFRITVDGQVIEAEGVKLYVVNSGMMGKGVRIAHEFSVDDGYLDVFVLGRDALSIMAAETRTLEDGGIAALPSQVLARQVDPGGSRTGKDDLDRRRAAWHDARYR